MTAVADVSLDRSLAILGPPASGKSVALAARVAALRSSDSHVDVFVAAHPRELRTLALHLLELDGKAVTLVDDVDAEAEFARFARGLVALEWEEFISGAVDPEVPGLRSPERFLDAAFRLVRRLSDAAITPKAFLDTCLVGATKFYAHPPNLAHPDLILGTKETYRDSLDVTPAELDRQRRREVDLAKILARLYDVYRKNTAQTLRMTARDAVALAAEVGADPRHAAALRERYPNVAIDEAQEMTAGERLLLEVIYGKNLRGVTLASDPNGAINLFSGARPDLAFAGVEERVELAAAHRTPQPDLHLHRAKTCDAEAAHIAELVRARLDAGITPDEIALLFRSVADVHCYEEALLDRNIPAVVTGDVNIFADRRALDALALLWTLWDPFRHEYVLRTLSAPAMALSDASIAALCAGPPDAQAALFELEDEPAPLTRRGRFDPRRDLRLGWNLTRGTVDDVLNDEARDRVRAFRSLRAGWIEALEHLPMRSLILRVWAEGLAWEGPLDGAKAKAQRVLLERLLQRLCDFAAQRPGATLGDVLETAARRSQSDLGACEDDLPAGFVQLRSIESARGRSFDTVMVPDARAGSFPRWYVPDAFLFSPKLGMIPKDNVGDARASRTAKFTYYLHDSKIKERYNAQERRAFAYALSRARREVCVTASGRVTRGITAPEFLAELQSRK